MLSFCLSRRFPCGIFLELFYRNHARIFLLHRRYHIPTPPQSKYITLSIIYFLPFVCVLVKLIPSVAHSFIHSVVCLTTGPKPLPKPALHIVRSRAPSFKWEYPLLSLRSPSSFLHLLPRLPVTSILPFIFPSITRCRKQFLGKMWPTQLAFCLLISCRISLCSLTLSNTYSFLIRSVQLIFSITLQNHISKLSRFFWSTARSDQLSAPCKAMFQM
jgi:hypothetical protein